MLTKPTVSSEEEAVSSFQGETTELQFIPDNSGFPNTLKDVRTEGEWRSKWENEGKRQGDRKKETRGKLCGDRVRQRLQEKCWILEDWQKEWVPAHRTYRSPDTGNLWFSDYLLILLFVISGQWIYLEWLTGALCLPDCRVWQKAHSLQLVHTKFDPVHKQRHTDILGNTVSLSHTRVQSLRAGMDSITFKHLTDQLAVSMHLWLFLSILQLHWEIDRYCRCFC